jgi:hypothetical protein
VGSGNALGRSHRDDQQQGLDGEQQHAQSALAVLFITGGRAGEIRVECSEWHWKTGVVNACYGKGGPQIRLQINAAVPRRARKHPHQRAKQWRFQLAQPEISAQGIPLFGRFEQVHARPILRTGCMLQPANPSCTQMDSGKAFGESQLCRFKAD